MGNSLRTHEEKHSFGIPFPTLHHLLVLRISPIEIHGEQSFGTVGKFGLFLRGLVLLVSRSGIYKGCS
jgi:hypothetical protein